MTRESQIDAPPIAASRRAPVKEAVVHDLPVSNRSGNNDSNAGAIKNFPQAESTSISQAAHASQTSNDQVEHEFVAGLQKTAPLWLQRVLDRHRTPAFLISFIVHTLALLILAIWGLSERVGSSTAFDFEATLSQVDASDHRTELQLASNIAPAPPAVLEHEAVRTASPQDRIEQVPMTELLQVQQSESANRNLSVVEQLNQALSDVSMISFASSGVEGRSLDKRAEVAAARGGTLESEFAVERALEWLAAHQQPGGGWSLVHDGGKCDGQCKNNGADGRYEPAATGLALLAFLGAGYTHTSGKYQKTVREGIYYLMQIMEDTPTGTSFLHQSERGMYNHGIATFALCEGYQLTKDEELRRAAQQAINFMLSAQNYAGGWGYLPKQPGDLTITGWQVMALKSAHSAGLEVPSDAIVRLDNFLGTQQVPSGVFYGYRKPDKHPTCSSIAMIIRLYRGWSHTDPRALELAQFLQKEGRSNGDAYFNYYATLLLFHVGGAPWEQWNSRMREHLIKTQATSGHETGSWYFENQFGKEGGRLYTTAMCAMTLEVYYRFSPLYQQADRGFEL